MGVGVSPHARPKEGLPFGNPCLFIGLLVGFDVHGNVPNRLQV